MRSLLLLPMLVLLSGPAAAQVTWQPATPPQVTAENEAWYRAGEAIEWNGEFYFPAGAAEAFNRYQMVRSGSYRGIPLYTDTTLEPYSIVFVPIAGSRVQPYERPRTGMLAGSVGSRTPAFPVAPATEPVSALGVTSEGYVAQAPAPPTFARSYDAATDVAPERISPAVPVVAGTIGQTSSAAPMMADAASRPTGTSGRMTAVAAGASTATRPTGINNAWLTYDGRRWFSAGRAVERDASFVEVGTYRGFPVLQRRGDSVTIFIPSTPGLLMPFTPGKQ